MTIGYALAFAGAICGPMLLILAIFAVVLAVRALRLRLRRAAAGVACAWSEWKVDQQWRRWEAVQERALLARTAASRARHTRLIGAAMRSALLAPLIGGGMGGMGDPHMALLATGWAMRRPTASDTSATQTDETAETTGGDAA